MLSASAMEAGGHSPAPAPSEPRPLIVGIGASAGGLEAFKAFFRKLPADVGAAFVVVQHLDPSSKTLLVELLAKLTPLAVVELVQSVTATAGQVYVAAPGTIVAVERGVLHPRPATSERQRRASIDEFFRSLAEDQGENAVGVVFSGAGTDGTLGLKALRDAGGLTLAQDPQSARYETMPLSAVSTGAVDHVLPPGRIPTEIAAYARYLSATHGGARRDSLQVEIEHALERTCEILRQETGQNFKHYKRSTLVRRVMRRMQVLRIADAERYLEHLEENRAERQALFKELLIGVTAFFRDPAAFEALGELAIAKILAEHAGEGPVRVWVPGCATGEEAYTIAILFAERLQAGGRRPPIQIFATDIDERAVAFARAGTYPQGIAADLSPERLQRFFVKQGSEYQVAKELRELCLFSVHNLISDPPFSRLDLISCRNLLIYLGPHLQRKLIPVFHYSLKPNGYLLLGPSENLARHSELFRAVSTRHRLSQRRPTAIPSPPPLSARRPGEEGAPRGLPVEADLGLIAQRILLDEFSPAYALVHEDGQVVFLSERCGRFLTPPAGAFQAQVVKMARPGLKVALRAALADAARSRRKVVHDEVTMQVDAGVQRVTVTVQPMPRLGEDSGLFMVVFQEVGLPSTRQEPRPEGYAADAVVEQLERELSSLREDLETTVQDLEAANEELKSSNEELLSMNEELQSANEELETSKDEVQAANEALARANTDLSNLLESTQIATIFLDEQYRIRGFTPAATEVRNLIRSDIGRPLEHTTHRFRETHALPAYEVVKGTSEPISEELETVDGRWFLRRVAPYRTAEGEVNGAVLTFLDITELKQVERALREATEEARRGRERVQRMLSSALVGIAVSTAEGRVVEANDAWLALVGRTREELERGDIRRELVVPAEDLEKSRRIAVRVDAEGGIASLEATLLHADGEKIPVLLSSARLEGGQRIGFVLDLRERKRAERALQESEARFHSMAEASPMMLWVTEPDGSCSYLNPRWYEFTGQTPEQALGFGWLDAVHPDDRDRAAREFADANARVVGHRLEYRLRRRDGAWRWTIDAAAPRFDAGGGFRGFVGSVIDITERREAEDALRASEQRYRRLAEAIPQIAWEADADGRVVYLNRRWYELTGRTGGSPEGWLESVHPDDRERCIGAWTRSVATGEPYEVECRYPVSGDGCHRWYLARALPVQDEEGRVVRWFGTATDIEDKKRVEGAIRESERRLQEVADAMPQIVWTGTSDGKRDYYNRRWYDLTGLTREGAVEEQWHTVLHPDDRDTVLDAWREAVERGRAYEIECRYWVPSESAYRWYLSRALPQRDAEGRVVRWIGTSTDIDDKKRLEHERENLLEAERAARGEVVRAGRLKDEFLATLSHELRTPLNAILGWAQLLRGGSVGGADLRQGLEVIERNARTQSRLISDLLDVNRIVSGRLRLDLQPVDVAEVAAAAVEALEPQAEEKGVALEVELARPGPQVRGDPARLEQVVWNLVSNALKFTPGGGSVRVSLEGVDGRAVLAVDDDGKGISPEFLPHLFERFSQGDPSITRRHGGLGLGLSIVKQLVELHGGTVRAHSDGEGRGARFVVELPTAAASPAPHEADARDEPAEEEAPPLDLSGLRVLVVDDEVDARELARRVLEAAGARVETAAGAEEALALIASFRPEVVVSDIGMPGEDGYRLLPRLRARADGALPAVALTAFVRSEDRTRARHAGFDEHVGKPLEPARLLAAIARAARR